MVSKTKESVWSGIAKISAEMEKEMYTKLFVIVWLDSSGNKLSMYKLIYGAARKSVRYSTFTIPSKNIFLK